MVQPEFIEPALTAKTKASVLRQMAALAEKTGRVCDPQALLQGLEAREELCSTGIPGGLALLHSRNPESYLFEIGIPRAGPDDTANPVWRAGWPADQPVLPDRLPRRPHAPAHPRPLVPDGAEDRPAG